MAILIVLLVNTLCAMEGVMGYYDGAGGITTKASAYELASDTRTPAVLIVNGKGMSLSIVPYIKGFLTYRSPNRKNIVIGPFLRIVDFILL